MSLAAARPDPLRRVYLPAVCGLLLVVAGVALDPEGAARGLLAAALLVLAPTVGAAALLHLHALTGGAFRDAGGRALVGLARSAPFAAGGGLVAVVLWGALYPPPDDPLVRAYMAWPAFAPRVALVLCFWGAMGFFAGRLAMPGAAAVLAVHYVALTVFGHDVVLALQPQFVSTAFGATLGMMGVVAALGVVAAAGVAPGRGVSDWGGLLLAAILALTYLVATEYLVMWYGNQADDARWWQARTSGLGGFLAGLAAAGALVPFFMLMSAGVRGSPRALRLAGGGAALGVAAYMLMLVGASGPALLAAAGGIMIAAAAWGMR